MGNAAQNNACCAERVKLSGSNRIHIECRKSIDDADVALVRYLVGMGTDPLSFEDSETGRGALHWAAFNGHSKLVEVLLLCSDSILPDMIARTDLTGRTALSLASFFGHADIVKLLCSEMREEDISLVDKKGRTALHMACGKNHADVVRVLLTHMSKENIERKDFEGRTCVDCGRDFPEIVSLLGRKGLTPRPASKRETRSTATKEDDTKERPQNSLD